MTETPVTSETSGALVSKGNLYQRINAVRATITYVKKDKDVGEGKYAYKAVTHDAVTGQIRQALIDNGILIIPTLVSSTANPKEVDADLKASKQFRYDATYSFRFINVDEPTEFFDVVIEAHAMDNGDKAPGKALSYAKKYAVLKVFEIETGENEESRYDSGDDPKVLNILLRSITGAKNEGELRTAYDVAMAEATGQNDQKEIIAAVAAKRGALKKEAAKGNA